MPLNKFVVDRMFRSRRATHAGTPEYADLCPLCGDNGGTYLGRYHSRLGVGGFVYNTRQCFGCDKNFTLVYGRDNNLLEVKE